MGRGKGTEGRSRNRRREGRGRAGNGGTGDMIRGMVGDERDGRYMEEIGRVLKK